VPLAYKPKIIAGNVCTRGAVEDLAKWGADAVKVGIAGGHACSTKNMTGFHIPMFSCMNEICEKNKLTYWTSEYGGGCYLQKNISVPIIADGGIRESGDIAKALTAGATMVMAGSIFAACIDAPGENVYGHPFSINPDIPPPPTVGKKYFGSASAKQKGNHTHVEGFEVEIPCNGLTYTEKYAELTDSLQSAVSYAGGKDLSAFKDVRWVSIK
jgi:GMP reductase